jgi:peptidoglycan/LPS O-acetylase OafA/YrhL
VKANPGAIRRGAIDAPPVDPRNRRGWRGLGMLAAVALLVATGPEPRLATRWAWFWLSATGVGLLAYVLAGGSRFTSYREDEEDPRVTGGQGLGAALLAGIVAAFVVGLVASRQDRDGEFRRKGTVPAVGRLDPQDHGP